MYEVDDGEGVWGWGLGKKESARQLKSGATQTKAAFMDCVWMELGGAGCFMGGLTHPDWMY